MEKVETEIYVKANPRIIMKILELVRPYIGEKDGVNIVDLKPNYNWDKDD